MERSDPLGELTDLVVRTLSPAGNPPHDSYYNYGLNLEPRHAWLHYLTDKPPNVDANMMHQKRPWENPGHVPNLTWTRGAYKPYST